MNMAVTTSMRGIMPVGVSERSRGQIKSATAFALPEKAFGVPAGDTARISALALAASASTRAATSFTKAFFDASASMTDDQRKEYYTRAANDVSIAQGLPPGQFNFRNMTSGEAEVVYNSMKLNGSGTVDSLAGFSEMINMTSHDPSGQVTYSDEKRDYTAMLTSQRDFESGAGNHVGADLMQASLDIITKFQASLGTSAYNANARLNGLLAPFTGR